MQRHAVSGEIYVLDYDADKQIVACVGPLTTDEARRDYVDLGMLESDDPGDVAWARQQQWSSPLTEDDLGTD